MPCQAFRAVVREAVLRFVSERYPWTGPDRVRRESSWRSKLAAPSSVALVLGTVFGLGLFTLGYGEGWAYLIDNPVYCANCHVMQGHLDSYVKSSHHAVATCNDCHLRHDAIGKWWTKADNGFFHSAAFTTGWFPDPIRIKPRNRRVTQAACLHCHEQTVNALLPAHEGGDVLLCAGCHRDVGHALR